MARCISAIAVLFALTAAALADDSKTFEGEGTWNNKLYGTSGPIQCKATRDDKGVWTATFTGMFMKDPFKYDVTFQGKKGAGGQETLAGTATIRNHKYQWQGYIKGDTLIGQYRANSGYNGQFVLKAK